jgi:hypothetical protein
LDLEHLSDPANGYSREVRDRADNALSHFPSFLDYLLPLSVGPRIGCNDPTNATGVKVWGNCYKAWKAEVRVVDLINGGEHEAVFYSEYSPTRFINVCGDGDVDLPDIEITPCPEDGYRVIMTCWNHFGESATASRDISRADCNCNEPDAGTPDTGIPDAGTPDAEAGPPEAGQPDAGPPGDGGGQETIAHGRGVQAVACGGAQGQGEVQQGLNAGIVRAGI